ncbi:MAG: HemK2/MTQ2 family protein methyltransferase [Candidatus Ranarchaeia archaeon]|jgi:release factor glutamine methyltransferase
MSKKSIHLAPFEVTLHPQVYEPAEDTYLLVDNLPDLNNKSFLEIGAGTGVVSLFAALTAQSVVCTDLNPYAFELIQENIEVNKTFLTTIPDVRQGDLFSPISTRERFDVIAFNPPYLPSDQHKLSKQQPDSQLWLEKSWEGGSTGIEITTSFLNQVSEYLSSNGLVYLIASSASRIQTVISQGKTNNLLLKVGPTLKFPFESLSLLFGGKTKSETSL